MRPLIQVLLALLILPAAGNGVAAEPASGDPAVRFQQALHESNAGHLDIALQELSSLREDYPQDVDYALARAQVLARLGRDEDALEDLRQAVILAPDYEEVWRLRYHILSQRQHGDARLEHEVVLREVSTRFPAASWWQSPEPDPATPWAVLVGASHENLDNNLPSWNQQFLEITRDLKSTGRYRVGAARDKRFDSSDVTLTLGGDAFFATDWSAGVNFTFVDQADFLPDYSYAAYFGRSFQNGWAATLRYQRREYETEAVSMAAGSVEKYFRSIRLAYTLNRSRLRDGSDSQSHSLALSWYYNDESSVGLSLYTGDEVESIAPGQVLKMNVRGASLNGRRKMSERWSLLWWLGLHDQGDFYRRQYFGMAVSFRI